MTLAQLKAQLEALALDLDASALTPELVLAKRRLNAIIADIP